MEAAKEVTDQTFLDESKDEEKNEEKNEDNGQVQTTH